VAAKWIPPPSAIAKINVDAAVSRNDERGVGAAFCRDNTRNYLGASVIVFSGITDPATLKSLACREALALAKDLGINRIYVASNCKTVVSDIKCGSKVRYGSFIKLLSKKSS
jgi:hypothetical protein